MQSSTFAPRNSDAGWVIDATALNGEVNQLVGVYLKEKDAMRWIAGHTPEWFKTHASAQ
jgi:hypothetical protein